MRLTHLLVVVLLVGCHTKKQPVNRQNNRIALPVEKEINIPYHVYNGCSTYYYFAADTLKPVLARVIGYDEKGREKDLIYRLFEGYVPATALTVYDTLGRKSVAYYRIDEKGLHPTSTKTYYFYNAQGQLTRSVAYDYQRRIKKEVDKGLGRPGGCIVTEDDYEKRKSWKLSTIWNFKYDKHGSMTEKFAPVMNGTQNRYLYVYDVKGRKIEERSLDGNRLIWIERYRYGQEGYEFTRTWYESDGTKGKEWEGSPSPVDTFRFKTNPFDNVTENWVIEQGGQQVNREKNDYDGLNRIIKHAIYTDSNQLLGYYKYQYTIAKKPTQKLFFVDRR